MQANSSERRGLRRLSAPLLVAAAALGLSGCGYNFGEQEKILQGDRVPLRAAKADDTRVAAPVAVSRPTRRGAWPQFGGGPRGSIGHIAAKIGLERVWSTSIGASSDSESRVTAPPVSDGKRIFALDAASQVTALDVATGKKLWATDVAPESEDGRDGFGGGLAVAGDVLVIATGFGEVIGLSPATGGRLWVLKVGAPIRSAPAVSRGLAVVQARNGALVGIEVKTGKRVWAAIGAEGGAAVLAASGPAISGEVIAAPFPSGDIGVFRLRDGRSGWREPLGGARRGSAISHISDVSSPPVMLSGRIYAGGVAGRIAAFEIPTGVKIWSRDIGSYSPMWASGDTLFVVSDDARVMALRASDGGTIWETQLERYTDPDDKEGPISYGGPILVGGKLFLVSTEEKIYRLDASTGKVEKTADLPGPTSIPPIVVGDRLIVVDFDGDAHAYK
ncbi:MAG: PQQ-binding-like beta-propeller repeat protein [Neomegalonema sp.]|nr:PQQ-binding-like beta-propeller repeat protein [Neomegalonema sp.]